jgi:hypothetical protein
VGVWVDTQERSPPIPSESGASLSGERTWLYGTWWSFTCLPTYRTQEYYYYMVAASYSSSY